MNISEAQKISIVGYLASLGIEPETYFKGTAWYNSPLRRGETKPSFKVNTNLNKWKDFGSDGKGGDLIDLICKMNAVSVTGALLILSSPQIAKSQYFSFRGEVSDNRTDENRLTVTHMQPLQNRPLIQYVSSRGIAPELAGRYVKECYYNMTDKGTGELKRYFSLAFENDGGGYAMRNRYFPNAASPATITTIPGAIGNQLSVFEGFFDFLSALQFYQVNKPKATVIVLNSTSHLGKLFPVLAQYEKINSFLDNDPTGQQATNEIKKHHNRVTDYSKIIYPDHKDFNEFLISNHKTKTV